MPDGGKQSIRTVTATPEVLPFPVPTAQGFPPPHRSAWTIALLLRLTPTSPPYVLPDGALGNISRIPMQQLRSTVCVVPTALRIRLSLLITARRCCLTFPARLLPLSLSGALLERFPPCPLRVSSPWISPCSHHYGHMVTLAQSMTQWRSSPCSGMRGRNHVSSVSSSIAVPSTGLDTHQV